MVMVNPVDIKIAFTLKNVLIDENDEGIDRLIKIALFNLFGTEIEDYSIVLFPRKMIQLPMNELLAINIDSLVATRAREMRRMTADDPESKDASSDRQNS